MNTARRMTADSWSSVRGVCFDLGGTLVKPDALATTARVGRLLGLTVPEARRLMEDGPKRTRVRPEDLAHRLSAQFQRPGLLGPLTRVLEHARARAADPELYDDALPTLRLLKARGLALFALTNSLGSSIPDTPPPYAALLDAVLYSADTGACKPEPAAFQAVQRIAGLPADRLLHVGDSLRADAAGAAMAGWHAVLLQRTAPTLSVARRPLSDVVVRIRTLTSLAHLLPSHTVASAKAAEGEQ